MNKCPNSKSAGSDSATPLGTLASGTITRDSIDPIAEVLLGVFERRNKTDTVDGLLYSLARLNQSNKTPSTDMSNIAFGIDTNVLIKIAKDDDISESMISYFGNKCTIPVILPGQTVQEFWNNMASFMETASSKLAKAFDQFKKVVVETKVDFKNHIEDIEQNLRKFENEYKGIYGKSVLDNVRKILVELKDYVVVSYCPRHVFYNISIHRKNTNTPPGFKDHYTNDGDFFVWVDFLYGLKKLQDDGCKFEKVVFITDDSKIDWVFGNAEHPILVLEVLSILGVSFEIWKSSKFIAEIEAQTSIKSTSEE